MVSHLASVRHTTVSMTNSTNRVEVITSVQRRRRWAASEKVRMVEETLEPGATVSLVARRHGVAPNQLFTWRRLVAQGALTAAGSGEEVVPASDYRATACIIRQGANFGNGPDRGADACIFPTALDCAGSAPPSNN